MQISKKHQGSAYLLVIMVFLGITLFSGFMVSNLNNGITQSHAYSLQMKARYLNQEMLEAGVAALLADDKDLLNNLSKKQTQKVEHINKKTNEYLGETVLTIDKQQHKYYEENKDWLVINAKTSIVDERAEKKNSGKKFTYTGFVMVLKENPLIQLYNTKPNQM